MQDPTYPFETLILLNRLDMQIAVDIFTVTLKDKLIVVIKANKSHHKSTIAKNIEHFAFQLKERFHQESLLFSLVEYCDREEEEWRQWRFNWVGNTPLESESYRLSTANSQAIKNAIENELALEEVG